MPRKPAAPVVDDLPPEQTVMVGANLPKTYARQLAHLHAETGRSKKALVQEGLNLLFAAHGVKGFDKSTSAGSAGSIPKGA